MIRTDIDSVQLIIETLLCQTKNTIYVNDCRHFKVTLHLNILKFKILDIIIMIND